MHELKISDIEAAGFREFPVNRFSELRYIDRNWQKTYRNDAGKKQYFVTIEQWSFVEYQKSSSFIEYPRGFAPYRYGASGQFTRGPARKPTASGVGGIASDFSRQ